MVYKMRKGSHHTEIAKEKIGLAQKGNIHGFKKGKPSTFKGKTHTKEAKMKNRLAHLGKPTWNKGKKMSKELVEKNRQGHLGYKPTKEAIRKSLKRNPMSSLEIKFQDIINKNNLPYKFVGNGEVLIGRKCPDFVNTNGQKIAIDVYYRRHKEQFRKRLKSWKSDRTKIFQQYGWDLKFFDETQVNEQNIRGELRLQQQP